MVAPSANNSKTVLTSFDFNCNAAATLCAKGKKLINYSDFVWKGWRK
jgi:hypothetical protein